MYDKVSNDELTDQELWGKLIEDLRYGVNTLPENKMK